MKNLVKSTVLLLVIAVLAFLGSCGARDDIGTEDLNDSAVTTAKLADDAVTGDKIADGAVSIEHLASGTLTVDSEDIDDEPGINFVSFDNVNLTSSSPSANRSFQMTIPAYGYVVLSATGQITIMGTNTFVQVGVSDASGSNTKTVQVGVSNTDETDLYQDHSFGVSAVYSVSPGAYTFYCNMSITEDKVDTQFDQCTLYALYVPTQY